MKRWRFLTILCGAAWICSLTDSTEAAEPPPATVAAPHPLHYLSTEFENASPLWWEVMPDGSVRIHLVYDHERASPNRANGHWLFRVEAEPGSDLTLVLGPFANIWNGVLSKPIPEATISFVSDDGEHWRAIPAEPAEPNWLRLRVHLQGSSLYVARLEPYRLSDLDKLKAEIGDHPLVEITPIGRTVEQRELEIIRVGKPDAPRRVLLRARAHPWEPGGNWVVEGLIRRLLEGDDDARRYRDRYCVYIMPLANKDGVARGRTRFNLRGMDLNRNWSQPADPALAPENAALENWLDALVAQGKRPDLAIDFHNDAGGRLHVSRPEIEVQELQQYVARMDRLEQLLRAKTWFTEGSTKSSFRNPGTIGEGLLARYGMVACIHELNANHIAGLDDDPTAENWKKYGRQLADVLCEYFAAE
ncbi:MAG: succinylglutamate desuccinylase/aspartoacylase family protein [Pirellulaceae bacterium]|nr:succinylglutamate desuccinylase/aspartoacylase family protein [Pirellulaceae bacterium]